jgi:hypothetical protein
MAGVFASFSPILSILGGGGFEAENNSLSERADLQRIRSLNCLTYSNQGGYPTY